MSRTPAADTQAAALPVSFGPEVSVLQVATPSPAVPGSGVPAAAACHSALVSRRLPALRQACCAWNQVT